MTAPKSTVTVPRIASRSMYERCKLGAMEIAARNGIDREPDHEDTYDAVGGMLDRRGSGARSQWLC